MDSKILFEVCCNSADDVVQAYEGGAQRAELNSAIFLGGLTPTLGTLIEAKRRVPLPLMCMVRPREGGFCYTEAEYAVMKQDAKLMLDNGADGIVFGFLHEDGTLDVQRCKEMVELIGDKESVFHRAIDVTPDAFAALDILIDLGVTRVLTSGQAPSVPEGIEMIKRMIDHAKGRIEILPGGGIKMQNAKWCLDQLGINSFHATAHAYTYDRSTSGNPAIFFGGAVYPPEDRRLAAESSLVAGFCQTVSR